MSLFQGTDFALPARRLLHQGRVIFFSSILALMASSCGRSHAASATTTLPPPKTTSAPTTSTTTVQSLPGRPAFDPQSFSFTSASVGWAWGPAAKASMMGYGPGVLARSTNGGKTWTAVPTTNIDFGLGYKPNSADQVRFISPRVGFLFGASLYVTTDGGATWVKKTSPGIIYDIQATQGSAYAMVSACGNPATCQKEALYKVARDGSTFSRVKEVPQVYIGSELETHGSSAYLLARSLGSVALWRSLGNSPWEPVATPCRWMGADFGSVAAWSESGLALVCGSEPSAGMQMKFAYQSTDSGSTWSKTSQIHSNQGYVSDLSAANENDWVLGEARGQLLVTHDSGHTWSQPKFIYQLQRGVEGWGNVKFITSTEAVAVPWTLNGAVLAISDDGGGTWNIEAFPSPRG